MAKRVPILEARLLVVLVEALKPKSDQYDFRIDFSDRDLPCSEHHILRSPHRRRETLRIHPIDLVAVQEQQRRHRGSNDRPVVAESGSGESVPTSTATRCFGSTSSEQQQQGDWELCRGGEEAEVGVDGQGTAVVVVAESGWAQERAVAG